MTRGHRITVFEFENCGIFLNILAVGIKSEAFSLKFEPILSQTFSLYKKIWNIFFAIHGNSLELDVEHHHTFTPPSD